MKDLSQKCRQKTLKNTPSVTSLLASGDGRSLSNKQSGEIGLSGQVLAPVSHLARRGNKKASKMSAISGQLSLTLSESENLQLSLENKLQQLLEKAGSTLYLETWSKKTTPAGRSYLAHTASVDPTLGKDFTGWGTAVKGDKYSTARRKTDG